MIYSKKTKENMMDISNVHCLCVMEYTPDIAWDDEGEIKTGEACLRISAQEFEELKLAGVKCKEYTEVVFAKTHFNETGEYRPIRQLMFKHVAYIDKATHTNF